MVSEVVYRAHNGSGPEAAGGGQQRGESGARSGGGLWRRVRFTSSFLPKTQEELVLTVFSAFVFPALTGDSCVCEFNPPRVYKSVPATCRHFPRVKYREKLVARMCMPIPIIYERGRPFRFFSQGRVPGKNIMHHILYKTAAHRSAKDMWRNWCSCNRRLNFEKEKKTYRYYATTVRDLCAYKFLIKYSIILQHTVYIYIYNVYVVYIMMCIQNICICSYYIIL